MLLLCFAFDRVLLCTQVAGPAGFSWQVTFRCAKSSNYPILVPLNVNLVLGPGLMLFNMTTQRTVASPPLAGTFTLSLDDSTVSPSISAFASATDLTTALQTLPGVTNVSISYGNSYLISSSWTITFLKPNGFVPALMYNASRLTGTSVTMTVAKVQNGSTDIFLDPIPGEFFQVRVSPFKSHDVFNASSAVCLRVHWCRRLTPRPVCKCGRTASSHHVVLLTQPPRVLPVATRMMMPALQW